MDKMVKKVEKEVAGVEGGRQQQHLAPTHCLSFPVPGSDQPILLFPVAPVVFRAFEGGHHTVILDVYPFPVEAEVLYRLLFASNSLFPYPAVCSFIISLAEEEEIDVARCPMP